MAGVFYVPLRQHAGETNTEEESAYRVDFGEENSPVAAARIRTRNLSITSPALLSTSYPDSRKTVKQLVKYLTTVRKRKATPRPLRLMPYR